MDESREFLPRVSVPEAQNISRVDKSPPVFIQQLRLT